MIKAKGNSGGMRSPKPGHKMVFAGIKGLVASGPGTKKMPDTQKLRPEGAVHIDAGNLKKGSGSAKTAAGSPSMKKLMRKGVQVGVRPEGPIKRDSASVVKP